MKTEWTYEEVTACAEEAIKKVMDFALMAKQAGDIAEWQSWRDQAEGIHRLWRIIALDDREDNGDGNRLYEPLEADDPPPPSLADQSDVLKKIITIVDDESRWDTPIKAAFHRGTIIGMCERVGIVGRRDESSE